MKHDRPLETNKTSEKTKAQLLAELRKLALTQQRSAI